MINDFIIPSNHFAEEAEVEDLQALYTGLSLELYEAVRHICIFELPRFSHPRCAMYQHSFDVKQYLHQRSRHNSYMLPQFTQACYLCRGP